MLDSSFTDDCITYSIDLTKLRLRKIRKLKIELI